MAKTHSPMWSLKAWQSVGESAVYFWCGSLGSGVFRRERDYTQLERYYQPFEPGTPSQVSTWNHFATAVAAWQGLSDADKASWNFYQDYRRRRPVMSGYNLFISKYLLSGGHPIIPPSGRRGDVSGVGWSMPEGGEGGEEMVVKSGQITGGLVTFGAVFATVPNVVLTPVSNDIGSYIYIAYALTKSTTGFTYHVKKHVGGNTWEDVTATLPIEWIATDAGNA